MFKHALLKFKTKRLLKKRKEEEMTDYKSSQKIALIVSDEFEDEESIKKIIKQLKNEGKEISILFFCHNIKKKSTELPHFHAGDISITGQINNDDLNFFLNQHYDFALCFDRSRHYLIDYVFSQIKSKCRVGIMVPARNQLFDMMVHSSDISIPMSTEVVRYIKMIQPNG